jgi:hypothetical protein
MRLLFFLMSLLAGASFVLAACSPAPAATPTTTQPVTIELETNPNPATMGDITLTIAVKDEKGSPIEGARVDVSVDHTDMTGMGMSGAATEQGAGKYAINANFSMSGNWKLTVYVRKAGLDYKEEIDLKIK